MKTPSFFALLFPVCAQLAHAQIQIVDSGASANQVNLAGTYSQNFDSLLASGTASQWVNNTTLAGWYSTDSNINYLNGAGLASSGTTNDRSLGINTSSQLGVAAGNRTNSFGLRFVNNTASLISSAFVEFDGEQWSRGANSPQVDYSLFFSYQIFSAGAGSIAVSSGWISVPELTFTSPNATLLGSSSLDGNDDANRMADMSSWVVGVDLAPGEEIWFRWSTKNLAYPSNYHGLTIDNLTISFATIPEPATYAALLGGFVLFAVVARRRSGKRFQRLS